MTSEISFRATHSITFCQCPAGSCFQAQLVWFQIFQRQNQQEKLSKSTLSFYRSGNHRCGNIKLRQGDALQDRKGCLSLCGLKIGPIQLARTENLEGKKQDLGYMMSLSPLLTILGSSRVGERIAVHERVRRQGLKNIRALTSSWFLLVE